MPLVPQETSSIDDQAIQNKCSTYTKNCHCANTLPPGSSSSQSNLQECCVYGQNNCSAPVNGRCADIVATDGTRIQAQRTTGNCSTQFICTGVGKPEITQSTQKIIKFKPQIPLPGSALFNGQEIVITGSTLGEYIAALYVFMVSAIGILATVMVFFGGIKWTLAAGDMGKIQDAKETISSAIIGVILALTAYLLLLTISPKLVKFTSLTLTPVKGIAQEFNESEVAFGFRGRPPSAATLTRAWLDDATTGVRAQYGGIIGSLKSAQVPEDMIYAIIYVESGGRPEVVSGAGACGIMQLLPATAGKTCDQLKVAQVGIEAGVAYLKQLASSTCPQTATRKDGSTAQCKPPSVEQTVCSDGDLYYVAAAYNGGVGANCGSRDCPGRTWWECQVNTGYQETRDYVLKVQAARTKLQCLLTTSGTC